MSSVVIVRTLLISGLRPSKSHRGAPLTGICDLWGKMLFGFYRDARLSYCTDACAENIPQPTVRFDNGVRGHVVSID